MQMSRDYITICLQDLILTTIDFLYNSYSHLQASPGTQQTSCHLALTNQMPVHNVCWYGLKTSADVIITIRLGSGVNSLQQKPQQSNKASQRKQRRKDSIETRPCSSVASFTGTDVERTVVTLLACFETELATSVLTDSLFDQVNGKRSSSIFQHHYNYLAKDFVASVLQNSNENTSENCIPVICYSKKQASKIQCVTYYIMDIQDPCTAFMIFSRGSCYC